MNLTALAICLSFFLVCSPLRAQAKLFAYVTDFGSNEVSVYSVDANTGALTLASVAATGL